MAPWSCRSDEECTLHQEGAGRLPVPPRVPGLLRGNTSVLCQLGSQGVTWHGISHRQTAEGTFSFKALYPSLLALKGALSRLEYEKVDCSLHLPLRDKVLKASLLSASKGLSAAGAERAGWLWQFAREKSGLKDKHFA